MREHIAVNFMVLIGTLAIKKKKKAQALYQFCYRCSEFQVLHQALKCVGSAAHSLVSNVSPVPIITSHAGPYAVHATSAMLYLL